MSLKQIFGHSDFTVYFYKRRATERNPYKVVVFMGKVTDRMYKRELVSSPYHFVSRPMTKKEEHVMKISWRDMCYRYTTVDGLLEDELALTNDQEWIEKLKQKCLEVNLK